VFLIGILNIILISSLYSKLEKMIKYIFTIITLLISYFSFCQDPILVETREVNLETEFIIAMQDVALEDYDEALDKFKKLKRQIHNDGIVEYEMAKIYLLRNNEAEAEFYIKKALEKDNNKLIYKQFLLDVLNNQKKYREAANLMEQMLEENSYERRLYFKTADLYQLAKQTDKALQILENLTKKVGYNRDIELHKVNILLRNRDYNKALKVIDAVLKKNKNDIKSLLKKALVHRMLNESKKAGDTYSKILKLDPKNPQAGSYLNAVNKFNKSEEEYIVGLEQTLKNSQIPIDDKIKLLIPFVNKVSKGNSINDVIIKSSKYILEQYPNNEKSNALHADILYNTEDFENSLKYYNESLKYSKNNYEVWKQIMTLNTMLGKWKHLAKISEESIDYYPNQVLGYYNAGRAYINLNKIDKGLDYLDEALSYVGENSKFKAEIVLMQANGYILKNKTKKAIELLKNLNEEFKNKHPFYWELMGNIEEKEGESEKAKGYWKKSQELGNNSERLLNKLK